MERRVIVNWLQTTDAGIVMKAPGQRIDFGRVAMMALGRAETIARALLPDGRRDGHEWIARNPRRDDRKPGSFKINLATGKWCDFATDDKGGDLISLAAYVAQLPQREAAIRLAESLSINPFIKA